MRGRTEVEECVCLDGEVKVQRRCRRDERSRGFLFEFRHRNANKKQCLHSDGDGEAT